MEHQKILLILFLSILNANLLSSESSRASHSNTNKPDDFSRKIHIHDREANNRVISWLLSLPEEPIKDQKTLNSEFEQKNLYHRLKKQIRWYHNGQNPNVSNTIITTHQNIKKSLHDCQNNTKFNPKSLKRLIKLDQTLAQILNTEKCYDPNYVHQ